MRLFQGVWQPVVPSFVRDGDSFQWVVDVVEWLSLGRELADGLSPPGVDVRLELDVDPLEWAVCQQLVRLGKLHEVYDGSRGERSVFFARAEYADKMSMTFGQKVSSMTGFPLYGLPRASKFQPSARYHWIWA